MSRKPKIEIQGVNNTRLLKIAGTSSILGSSNVVEVNASVGLDVTQSRSCNASRARRVFRSECVCTMSSVSHCYRGNNYLALHAPISQSKNKPSRTDMDLIGRIVMQSSNVFHHDFLHIAARQNHPFHSSTSKSCCVNESYPAQAMECAAPRSFGSIATFKYAVQLCTDVGHNTFPRLDPYGLTMLSSCQCTLTCAFHDGVATKSQS